MKKLSELILSEINSISDDISFKEIDIQKTNENIEGDITILLTRVLKNSKINKTELENKLASKLIEKNIISSYNVINVFFNIILKDDIVFELFKDSLNEINQFPDNKNKTVLVEYSSPNTNKPLHLGHLRNIFIGYSLSQLLKKLNYNVKQVTLVNDRGIHICKSMVTYTIFGDNKTPETEKIKGDHFVGNFYVKFDQVYKNECKELNLSEKNPETPILNKAKNMLKLWEEKDTETINLWSKMNKWVLDGFNETYKTLGIKFDKEYYESNTYMLGKEIINLGLEKKIFYREKDNSIWIDMENVNMGKKLLLRSDGTSVYITQDLGTIEQRYKEFNFYKMLYVVGDEQIHHFNVLFEILKKLKVEYSENVTHISYGMVELPNGKMKSREGTVVDADDLIQEMYTRAKEKTIELGKLKNESDENKEYIYKTIGLNSLKFYLLKVDPKKKILFDPAKSIDFNGDTAPFIMYTYVRIVSILNKNNIVELKLTKVEISEIEKRIIFLILEKDEVIKRSADTYNPSLLTQYLLNLCKTFNHFYEKVNISKTEIQEKYNFYIRLLLKLKKIIEEIFDILGMNIIEHM